MKRRNLLAGATVAATAVLLAACAPSTGGSGSSGNGSGKVTLTVWSWRTEDVVGYKAIFDIYTKKHPNVTINFQAFKNTDYVQTLTTGLTGSNATGPDIVQVQAYGAIQPFIAGGNLVAINDLVKGLNNIDPSALNASLGPDGKTYGVPFATQQLGMWYNKDLFAKYNLQPPQTWADFIKINDTLKANGITPLAVGAATPFTLTILHSVLGTATFGGDAFGKAVNAGTTTFNDPVFVKSIQIVKDMQKYMPDNVTGVDYPAATSLFLSGKAGMFASGSFEESSFQKNAPNMNLGFFAVPGMDSQPGAVTAYQDGSFALNKASKNQAAATDLLNWMTTTEFGQAFSDNLKQVSSVNGVVAKDPIMKQIGDIYRANPQKYLIYTDYSLNAPKGSLTMQPLLQKLFLGQIDAVGLAKATNDAIMQWFKPTK